MSQMYEGRALRKQEPSPKAGITRRGFLRGLAVLGGAYAASRVEAKLIPSPTIVVPEEEVSFLKTVEHLDLYVNDRIIKAQVPTVYVQFRDSVFQLYTVRVNEEGIHPLSLIYGGNNKAGNELKPELAHKAWDLFEILSHNKREEGDLEEGVITSFKFKRSNKGVKAGVYDIPLHVPYTSLEEVLVTNNPQMRTKFI